MSDDTKRNATERELDDVSGGVSTNPVPPHGQPPTHPGQHRIPVDPPFPPGKGRVEPGG